MSPTNELSSTRRNPPPLCGSAKRKHAWPAPCAHDQSTVSPFAASASATSASLTSSWRWPEMPLCQRLAPTKPGQDSAHRSTHLHWLSDVARLVLRPPLSQPQNGQRCADCEPFNVTHRQVAIRFGVFESEGRRKWGRGSTMEKVCEIQRADECVCDHDCDELSRCA